MNNQRKTVGVLLVATMAALAGLGTGAVAHAATVGARVPTAASAGVIANADSYATTTVQQITDLAGKATGKPLGTAQTVTVTTLGADKLSLSQIKALLGGKEVGGVERLLTVTSPKPTDTVGGYAGAAGVAPETVDLIVEFPDGTLVIEIDGMIIILTADGRVIIIQW